MYKSIIVCLSLALLVSCESKEHKFEECQFAEIIEVGDESKVILNDTLPLRYPTDIMCIDDYLVVLDPSNSPCLYIFNKNDGKLINAVIKKGRGPGEVLNINSGLSYNNNHIGIFDGGNSKLVLYPKEHLLNASSYRVEHEIKIPNITGALRAYIIGDSILVRTTNPDRRFLWVNKKGSINIAKNNFPIFEDDIQINANLLSYANLIGVHPNGEKIVETSFIGGILEILDKKGNKFEQTKLHTYTKPVFELTDKGQWVTWCDQTHRGFIGLSVTDNVILTHYGGNKCSEESTSTRLRMYNWNGEPIKEYISKDKFRIFTLDHNTNNIYAIIKNNNGDFVLCRYILQ